MVHAVAAALAIVLFSSPVVTAEQDARPDFSGTWAMDAAKSDLGQMPAPESMIQVIEHKDPTVKVTLTQKGPEGELTTIRTLTTDGQENRNAIKTMDGEQPIVSRSKWNGRALATVSSLTIQDMAMNVTETWELAADGKTLTTTREITTDRGAIAMKIVFTRQ